MMARFIGATETGPEDQPPRTADRSSMAEPPLYRHFATQAELDAQYDPSLAVSDPAGEQRHYVERSALARSRLRCVLDVPYGPTREETLDIFPADAPGAPVFIFIHGGYWSRFSSKDFSCVALGLHGAGITTIVVNYALAPHVGIDEISRQVRAAASWVLRHIAQHGGDPRRVAIGGHSAGAHLAAMCLQTDWARAYALPAAPFSAAILVSGIYDLAALRFSYLQPRLQLDEGVIRRNSPAFLVRPCPTPVLITWGSLESSEFARQSRLLHDAWTAHGNASELSTQADAHHFTAIHGFETPSSPLCQWVQRRLR